MTTEADLGFDPAALRERYRVERERRLRSDGIDQYVEVARDLAEFAHDPWADPGFSRPPLRDEVEVAIVGAGFGGLLVGARLRELGVRGIRLIDKAAGVGGTWYWNRYRGIAGDIESYVYIPLLEELGYMPGEKYSRGAEIFEHCRRIERACDLYQDACLQPEVREIRWDERDRRWVISTDRDDEMRARWVCLANGFLQKPKLPGIPGLRDFRWASGCARSRQTAATRRADRRARSGSHEAVWSGRRRARSSSCLVHPSSVRGVAVRLPVERSSWMAGTGLGSPKHRSSV